MSAPITTQWRRLRPLGRGASGAAVSLALDPSSGLLFAVKSAAHRNHVHGHDHILRRELSILSSLPPHPHLIPLLGSSVTTTNCSNSGDASICHHHIFLSYAPGGAVADQIRLRGRLDEPAIRRHVFGVVSALAHVHAHSVTHCDVKPDNILVGGDGGAILADFGCARRCVDGEPLLRGEAVMGTPAYLAPEAARGEEQGPAADVWALGCAAVEMATGSSPYNGSSNMDGAIGLLYRIGYDECYAPQAPTWLSEKAQDFVRKCLRRDPRERPAAAELLRHPFVAAAEESGFREKQKLLRISPRSTLEESIFWGSSDEDEVEEIAERRRSDGGAGRRIGELAGAGRIWDVPEWTVDDEGWIAVRGCGRDCGSNHRCVADVADDEGNDNDSDDDLGRGGLNEGVVVDDEEERLLLLGVNCISDCICISCSIGTSKAKAMNETLCYTQLLLFCYYYFEGKIVGEMHGQLWVDHLRFQIGSRFAFLVEFVFLKKEKKKKRADNLLFFSQKRKIL